MKQVVPFTKDITFKSKIGELVSISLDHDLQLKGEDIITGNFYVKGKYKLTTASAIEDEFSYKVPCEIAISDDYDTFDATIDIDNFYYDVINNEILKINIEVAIDKLIKKEKPEEQIIERDENKNDKTLEEKILIKNEKENVAKDLEKIVISSNDTDEKIVFNYEERDMINPMEEIQNIKKEIFNNVDSMDTYSTYIVYLVSESDTYETICDKYHVKKEDILLYNDINELNLGMKLVIPDVLKNE